ncbi:MAG: pyridoxal phosphate-dependent aminotransferase [Melioribacteraceae bacterium]|nr:pyridoxal phosphate-dependent aminotransferase [Melioribacteraceae bacterium]
MTISRMAEFLKESPTLCLNQKAAEFKRLGKPIIHLGGGEPKSKAPESAIIATKNLLNSGEVRYSPASGIPDLKKAVIKYTEKNYFHKFSSENIIISSGAKQAIMVALQAILNPGDEILYPSPYWVSYPEMAIICGAKGIPINTEQNGFIPKIEDFEKSFNANTKAVIINSPNNPSGKVYPKEFIRQIIEFCEQKNIYLIMDDIYNELIFDEKKKVNPLEFVSDLSADSKLIITNGVSKAFAMTGFRIGWAIANPVLITAMTNIQAHQTSGPSILGQVGALAALEGEQREIEDLRLNLQHNRNILLDLLKSIPNIEIIRPEGTFYSFVNFSKIENDSVKLAKLIMDKTFVLTVPGIDFGSEGYLRISYCGSIEEITEGINRIKWLLDPNSPNEYYLQDRVLVKDNQLIGI